tara:strand:- start:40203 stop:41117 length:915 start_codon:yes stop_codon:yes gene_type:complete
MRHINAGLELAPVLEDIAREAGEHIMRVYAQAGIDTQLKADQSPVTQADLLAHECILRGLQAAFPDTHVVSEEDNASQAWRLPTGCHWLVDPLDGTKEFLNRNGDFTVNIALIENGRATFGMVYAPAHDAFYWGGAGLGAAMRNQGVVSTLTCPRRENANIGENAANSHANAEHLGRLSRMRVVASKSHLNTETQAFMGQLGAIELVQAGSSLKFCTIASGQADLYPRLGPTCEWDTAAAQAVLEGAGGVVLDMHGQPLHYGKANVLNPWFVAAARAEDAHLALRLNAANLPAPSPAAEKPRHD